MNPTCPQQPARPLEPIVNRRGATSSLNGQPGPQGSADVEHHDLEIDYTAFISNREVIAASLSIIDAATFQRLAVTVATARTKWVSEALRLSESGSPVTPDQTARLTAHRNAYDELSEAYEGLRRMVERGYIILR
jgi:hypothetical protein